MGPASCGPETQLGSFSAGEFTVFILGWVDTLVEAPVLTAAGHLDDVELTHTSFTRINVLHINKDQCSTAAFVILTLMWRNTAAAGHRLHTQRATGTDKHCVTQHPMTDFDSFLRAFIVEQEVDFMDSLLVWSSEPERQLGGLPRLQRAAMYWDLHHTGRLAEVLS